MLRPGDIVAGKYRIERELGAGGMGAVFVAVNEVLQKQVAIKVMGGAFASQPDAVARFFREAMSASKVRHPAIVEIYDAGSHEGAPWMAMQLLDGESLSARIARGPLPLGELVPIFGPVLSALDAVHANGIVHRDLKPDNIFLERLPDGRAQPKLLDFGIAKSQDGIQKLTQTGAIMGTAHYLAPEQARDSSTVDPRTDLYAIGVVLYEALSGRMPHEATTLPELISKLVTDDPIPILQVAPQVPVPVANVVHWCLARDPSARPQRAGDLATHLAHSLAGVPSSEVWLPASTAASTSRATGTIDPVASTAYAGGGGTHPITAAPSPFGALSPSPQPQYPPAASPAPISGFGPPPPSPYGFGPPPPGAARPSSGAGKWIAIALGAVALFGACVLIVPAALGAGLFRLAQNSNPRVRVETDDETPAPDTPRRWYGHLRPFLVDVNHDGATDIVGWLGQYPSDLLCAFDGTTGAELWCSSYGEEPDGYSDPQTLLVGSRIVHIDPVGNASAYELRTGERLAWQASVEGGPEEVCALGTDRVAVRTRDRVVSILTIGTGAVALAGGAMPAECEQVPTTARPLGAGAGYRDHAPGWAVTSGMGRDPEFHPRRRRVRGNRGWLSPSGTEIVLVGLTVGTERGAGTLTLERAGEVVWEAIVPTAPLLAEAHAPDAIAIAGDTVYATYPMTRRADAPRNVTAFRLSDGARIWDVPMTRARRNTDYLLADERNVYLASGDMLFALDAGSGQERFQIGGRPRR